MSAPRGLSAAIFDLDGVIVDTANYHFLAWKRLADELGIPFTAQENERLKGVSRLRSVQILLALGGVDADEQTALRLADRKNRWYVEHVGQLQESDILPGSREFLCELKANKIPVALASGSKNAPLVLERLGLGRLFDVVVDGHSATRAKPDPEVFLVAAKRLAVEPAGCVVFEDAAVGIEAARAAGMVAIGVGDPRVLAGADHVVDSLAKMSVEALARVMAAVRRG